MLFSASMRHISANPYTAAALALIARHPSGRILDCGAGLRPAPLNNVLTCDVSAIEGLDLLARGEALPFQDATFDGILSLAVLEHTADPFAHGAELIRVLKPGGELLVDAAFLQPWHGFPSHWFAFTRSGLEKVFADLEILDCTVGPHQQPWVSLRWMLERFASGIPKEEERKAFLERSIGEVLDDWRPRSPADDALCIDDAATEELAAGFSLLGRKPLESPSKTPVTPSARSRLEEVLIENRELRRHCERLEKRLSVKAFLGRAWQKISKKDGPR